jgi:cytochrome bd-type quinol oxidase subunit 2
LLSKVLILGAFLVILYTLASSFYFLVKDSGEGERTVRRLSWRVGLSLGLVILLWIAFQMGWIEPQGVNPVRYPADGG